MLQWLDGRKNRYHEGKCRRRQARLQGAAEQERLLRETLALALREWKDMAAEGKPNWKVPAIFPRRPLGAVVRVRRFAVSSVRA